MSTFPWQTPRVIQHSQNLISSFRYWTGLDLINAESNEKNSANVLYHVPFVVVSHGIEPDPVFNYGNQVALNLWDLDWENFTRTPSRKTVKPDQESVREELLKNVQTKGYIDNYEGIRFSSTGLAFKIKNVIVWNVMDQNGSKVGQAATFANWEYLKI